MLVGITPGPFNNPYPGFLVRTKSAGIIDSIIFITPFELNKTTPFYNFLDFLTPDTMYYCALADFQSYWDTANSRILLAKVNLNGDIYWQKYFGNDANYCSGSVAATRDGGCLIQWGFWDWVTYPGNPYNENILLIKVDKNGNAPFGIDENDNTSGKQILVYPNPASEFINFETGLYSNLTLQIYMESGQLLYESVLKQGKNTVQLSGFKNGLYFYRILKKDIALENGLFVKE
jgi:hypothetical protein